jgi:hypothetical protein
MAHFAKGDRTGVQPMMRILVMVFFWLCAVALLSLSIWSEMNSDARGQDHLTGHAKDGTHQSSPR